MKINAHFRFNKVGQGLFYTGQFNFRAHDRFRCKSYNMVYDCGSESATAYIDKEIRNFAGAIYDSSKQKLDLLIISHFDKDHINEVEDLLKQTGGCKHVVLPYLFEEEQLALYAFAAIKRIIEGPDEDGSNDTRYLNLILKPIDYLEQLGVDRITFILNDGETAPENKVDSNNPSGENGSFDFEQGLIETDNFKEVDVTNYINRVNLSQGNIVPQLPGTAINICHDESKIFIKGVWEFFFYNLRINSISLLAFSKEISAFLKKEKKTIQEAVANNMSRLKIIYNKYFPKGASINLTSLIVYHSPINNNDLHSQKIYHRDESTAFDWILHCYFANTYIGDSHKRFSTLLTGDIILKYLTLPQYILDNNNTIRFVQIPHHGSKTGWNLSRINTPPLQGPVYAIVNYGLGNTYNHPNSRVVDDIVNSTNWYIAENNQLTNFVYSVNIKI